MVFERSEELRELLTDYTENETPTNDALDSCVRAVVEKTIAGWRGGSEAKCSHTEDRQLE